MSVVEAVRQPDMAGFLLYLLFWSFHLAIAGNIGSPHAAMVFAVLRFALLPGPLRDEMQLDTLIMTSHLGFVIAC